MVRVHFFPFDVSLSNDRVLQFLNGFQQLRWGLPEKVSPARRPAETKRRNKTTLQPSPYREGNSTVADPGVVF